jgi:hypothetical protein
VRQPSWSPTDGGLTAKIILLGNVGRTIANRNDMFDEWILQLLPAKSGRRYRRQGDRDPGSGQKGRRRPGRQSVI